jgi:hypothetical protein
VRKLAANRGAVALRPGAGEGSLGSIALTPNVWPTAAVIDWLDILKRVDGIPDARRRLEEANQVLRGRLTYSGTTLKFSTEESDFWWWLMDSADANAARLILAVLDDPAWKDDLPRMVVGSLARQRRGAWLTTTANLGARSRSTSSRRSSSRRRSRRDGRRSSCRAGRRGAVARRRLEHAGGGRTRAAALAAGNGTLSVAQQGSGKPWLTVQSLAAIPLKAPLAAGYSVARSVSAVEQKDKARWSRGDIVRVRLEIDAQADMTWVVVSDPVPGGATILGSGLGRDSALATRGEKRAGAAWTAYEERGFEAWRGYYEYLPRGKHVVEYSVASTTRARSRCRRRGSRGCMRRRASARRRTRRSRSRRDLPLPLAGEGRGEGLRGPDPGLRRSSPRRRSPPSPQSRPRTALRPHPARPPRQCRSRRCGSTRTVRRLGWVPLVRNLAGAADGDRPERGPALLGAQRRRLGRSGASAWGNLIDPETRGASTPDDAARRPARRRPGPSRRAAAASPQKLGQALTATRLEAAWKKSEILEAYLNAVPFRGEIVGIDALSQTLFGKRASGLDAQEAAVAAALVRAPNAKAARWPSAPAACCGCSGSTAPASSA